MSRRSHQAGLGAAATLLAMAGAARAEPRGGSFSWVRGAGADACPVREQVVTELDRALGRPLWAALEGRALEGVIVRAAAGWEVTLYWRAPDGTAAGTRRLHDDADGCDSALREVVTSVAVALGADALDARSRAAPPDRPAAPTPAPAPAAPPAPIPPATPEAPLLAATISAPGPSATTAPHLGDVMLGGVVAAGWLPVGGYGMELVAEPLVYGRLRVALVATALSEQPWTSKSVTAGLTAVDFGADGCGVVWAHPRRWLDAAACLGARGGVIQASVYKGLTGAGGAAGSFAVQLGADLRSHPWGPLALGLSAGGRVTVPRYSLGGIRGDPDRRLRHLAEGGRAFSVKRRGGYRRGRAWRHLLSSGETPRPTA